MGTEPIGLCRCCGAFSQCRMLNKAYEDERGTEVYSEMIKDCFGIELSLTNSRPAERLVCVQCIIKLRQSLYFKIQVMQMEQSFLQHRISVSGSKLSERNTALQWSKRSGEIDYDTEELLHEDDTLSDGFDDEIDAEQLSEYESLDQYNDHDVRTMQGTNIIQEYSGQSSNRMQDCSEYNSDDGFSSINIDLDTNRNPKKHSNSSHTSVENRSNTAFTDPFMQGSNITSIVKYSFACPFKNRFNHIRCYYCDKYFLDPTLLREHTMTHNPRKEFKATRYRYTKLDLTRIDCRLCTQKIESLDDFKRHLVAAHGKNYFQMSKDCILPFKLIENVHKCTMCEEEFTYFYALYKHMNQHFSNYVCETCGIGFMDETSLQKHTPSHDSKRFPCATCGNTFKSEYTRTCHIRRIHNKEDAGSFCTKCDAYLLVNEKRKHMVEVHGEPPTVSCMGCDEVFKSRRLLTIHVRRVHMNDYRYECQICKARFFRRSSLTFHMPRHTGARDHQCAVCHKRYPRLKTLLEHMKIHNNVRRYRCHICGQAFVQNCSLKGHMKSKHPECE